MNTSEKTAGSMEDIVSLCKRRGFIFPGSDIYGGLAGTYDYGHLGLALKRNIEQLWWRMFVESRDDMFGIDSAILMNPKVWEASGHVAGFSDPLVECKKCKHRFRADHIAENGGNLDTGLVLDRVLSFISLVIVNKLEKAKSDFPEVYEKYEWKCEICNTVNNFKSTLPRSFNMMFRTSVGSVEGEDMAVYLRPETAQGMFVNVKNIIDAHHPKLPFGIAQIGKSFRNEIAPRDFIFRVRELEIMELEYFHEEKNWEQLFDYWKQEMHRWFTRLGFEPSDIQEVEVGDGDRAHYSKRTTDFYFKYPFGFKEIGGLAYRTDFDLKNHIEKSGAELRYHDATTNEKFVPHVLEPTFGLGRHVLAVIAKAYREDDLGGEKRIYLAFPKHLAPIKVAVFPLLKNKPELVVKAEEVYRQLKEHIPQSMFDDNGNIGKRYRRQDEIGTPYCVTVDFDTLGENPDLKDTVTIRERDTGEQRRVNISELVSIIQN